MDVGQADLPKLGMFFKNGKPKDFLGEQSATRKLAGNGVLGDFWKRYCGDPERSELESNPSGGLILRNLLILRNSKTEKNHRNAKVGYTAGTRRVHGRIQKFAHTNRRGRSGEGQNLDSLLRR